jgi:RimJ/RimL family protein N-acetyltransferase
MRHRIKLEYFTKDDFDQLINWVDNERTMVNWTGFMFNFPLTHDSLTWYLEDSNAPGSSVYIYKAIDTADGSVVGHISLGNISEKNRSARISRVLVGSNAHRGKGICQTMVKAVLKVGFEKLKLHRISLGVFSFNKSAILCYQKCGFRVEGETRDTLRYEGEWWSMTDMGILEDEYRLANKDVEEK